MDNGLKSTEQLLVNFLRDNPAATGAMIFKALHGRISVNAIHRLLNNMQAEGLIHRKGNTSAARWFAGADEIEDRNHLVMRIRSLVYDTRKVAAQIGLIDDGVAADMRKYADGMESIARLFE